MLGENLADPLGLEGKASSVSGLGYLPIVTELKKQKQLTLVEGTLNLPEQALANVKGYEIHAGVSTCINVEAEVIDNNFPISITNESVVRHDGTLNDENTIFGTYLHGIFDEPAAFEAILSWAGLQETKAVDMTAIQEEAIDRIAESIEESLDLSQIWPNLFEKKAAY